MKRSRLQYLFAVGARWVACGIAALLVWRAGAFAAPFDGVSLFLLAYCVIYTACWSRLAQRWWTRFRDGSLVLLYDLTLSSLPVWGDGGWQSPFLPVALGVLVVPALSLRWRTGLIAAALFTLLDQSILWATSPTPWQITQQGQTLLLLGRTLLPYGIVLVITGSMRVLQYMHQRPPRPRSTLQRPQSSSPPPRHVASFTRRSAAYDADSTATQTTQTIRAVKTPPPATVRQTSTNIQSLVRQLRRELDAAGVSVVVQIDGDDQQLPDQIKLLLDRTLEVAVDNVVAHANATSVGITLRIKPATALLEIIDDGVGIPVGRGAGVGLSSMRERASELGGSCVVEPARKGGTQVLVRLPLAKE